MRNNVTPTNSQPWYCAIFLLLFMFSFIIPHAQRVTAPCPGIGGTGADGRFDAMADTTLLGGTYNFTEFVIREGITVTVRGTKPLVIYCTGTATISGKLAADGDNGTNGVTFSSAGIGGLGVAGGKDGGNGVYASNVGPLDGDAGLGEGGGTNMGKQWSGGGGAGHAGTGSNAGSSSGGFGGPSYGTADVIDNEAGSGGGGGSGGYGCGSGGGGGGGGYVSISATRFIVLYGAASISVNGGNGGSDGRGNCGGGGGGSAGSILLRSPSVSNFGNLSAAGGAGGASAVGGSPYFGTGGAGSNGRIRIYTDDLRGDGVYNPEPVSSALTLTYYQDADGDGYGNPLITQLSCTKPEGYVLDNTDCNDANKDSYPGATEICNGIDDNCDGAVDEGFTDTDGDGMADCVDDDDDNDGLPDVEDCAPLDATAGQRTTWYEDRDGDGYGNPLVTQSSCTKPDGYVASGTDCDDSDKDTYPGAPEKCGDGKDNNCNGKVDEDCTTLTACLLPSALNEGNSGKANMFFAVILNKPAPGNTALKYKTTDGTAKAGKDYVSCFGTITFAKGQWIKFIPVSIIGDKLVENNEYFYLQLSATNGVTVKGGGKVYGVILDDDKKRSGGYSITEGLSAQSVLNEQPESGLSLKIPNLLRRGEAWRIPSLPAGSELTVTDASGKTVLRQRNYQGGHSFRSTGLYLYQIHIRSESGTMEVHSGKLMVTE